MIKTYTITDGRVLDASPEEAQILVYINPDDVERRALVHDYAIDEHTLHSSLDPDELSRLEFEPDHIAMILKRPKRYSAEDNFLFRVMSLGLFLFQNKLIIVTSEEMSVFETKRFFRIKSIREIVLKYLFQSITHFIDHLKVIHQISEELEDKISASMENKYLLYMFILEKSLVYYLNAISSNTLLLQRLKNYETRLAFSQDEKELLDDLLIENAQCYRQAEIYSNILSGLMDARASIVNNNLNILMKRLAVLTVVVGAVNIPASMGGMSEFSRFIIDGFDVNWWVANLLFFFALVGTGFLSYKALAFFKVFSTEERVKKNRPV
ncbi:MAG: hypothetical protein A2293_13595 [Elusimicrobia bacterium RIFOXYB2_FULL_49_7]|nr:MAG: hypothetical protein A2293_13595 [Elusimicrobia bacterium RIFOXYB2_FULL_49_7]